MAVITYPKRNFRYYLFVVEIRASGIAGPIPLLLILWLLASPGQQQSWYCLAIGKEAPVLHRLDLHYLQHLSIEKVQEISIYCYVP